MLISSTLPNRANAGFEPTPERIATIITHCILDLNPARLKDGESFTILEPCIGRGDLAAPVVALPQTQILGIEQDPARAAHTRARFPQATMLTADLGTVRLAPVCFSLALCNFPYGHDALLGGRLEYQMLKQVTEALLPGGVLVTIVPARSGWDTKSIRYIGTHYQTIQAWRFFDESAQAAERFSTFTQIVVVAIKRPAPLLRVHDEVRATLQGWRWDAERGWAGAAPDALPATPILARYQVPGTTCQPAWTLTRASDDELLASLRASGVHTTAAWADATTWQAQAIVPNPLMAYAGTSHIVGGVVAVLLHWKQPLHRFVEQIGERDIHAMMQFVLIALVILPVLPDQTYGPYQVLNPREIWRVVVLIVGIGLAGYVAYKLIGQQAGALLGGMLGGLISSTATTVAYARRAKRAPDAAALAALVIMIVSSIGSCG